MELLVFKCYVLSLFTEVCKYLLLVVHKNFISVTLPAHTGIQHKNVETCRHCCIAAYDRFVGIAYN